MPDFIMLMHCDATADETHAAWQAYLQNLQACGGFRGGSVIGDGQIFRKDGMPDKLTEAINGYILIEADSFEAAKMLISGNPTYEAGGTVEIRELPEG